MLRLGWNVFVAIGILNATAAFGQDTQAASEKYKALVCPRPTVGTPRAILKRDGANREVDPYLSSLGQGLRGSSP